MTPKQIATRNVVKMVAFALIVGFGTGMLLSYVPLAILGIGACVVMLGFLIKMVYELELDKAERLEKLNNPKA